MCPGDFCVSRECCACWYPYMMYVCGQETGGLGMGGQMAVTRVTRMPRWQSVRRMGMRKISLVIRVLETADGKPWETWNINMRNAQLTRNGDGDRGVDGKACEWEGNSE